MTYQIETDRSPRRRGVVQSIWDIGVITSLVILAFTAQSGNSGQQSASSPARPVSAAEVAGNYRDFIGKTVTIKSKPSQKLDANSFTLKDGMFAQQEPLLVVNATKKPFNVPAGNVEVQIIGQVRDFSISDIEREYKLNLNDDVYSGYIRRPVLVAQNIALAPQPDQVAQNPQKYNGKTVAVTGEVEKTEGSDLITLNKDQWIKGKDLPVVLTSHKIPLNQGQQVTVLGEVRPFNANAIQQEYNLSWNANVKQQLEDKYKNTPVVVADVVYP